MPRRTTVLLAAALLFAAASARWGRPARSEAPRAATQAPAPALHFDVSDVSYLFPAPRTAADLAALVPADTADPTTGEPLIAQAAFTQLLALVTGDAAAITHPDGQTRRIGLRPGFDDRANWKVASFRVDPGAPGGHGEITSKFGASPQLRLILQPVTADGAGNPTVHDFTIHLVYAYTAPRTADQQAQLKADALKGIFTPNVPDKVKFRAILDDLAALKDRAKAGGVDTDGQALGVHPGFAVPGFTDAVKAFLTRHVAASRLFSMAFMGLPAGAPEPWIFVAVSNRGDGTFIPARIPALGGRAAEMFTRQDGEPKIFPAPLPTNLNAIDNHLGMPLAERRGVATAALFADGVDVNAAAVIGVDTSGQAVTDATGLLNRDIADVVANPQKSHFFSVDCLSCHSESTRRSLLNLPVNDALAFKPPAGVSGVDPAVLPTQLWNVRNFGWFPDFFNGNATTPAISQRTANESADSVTVINRDYFGNP